MKTVEDFDNWYEGDPAFCEDELPGKLECRGPDADRLANIPDNRIWTIVDAGDDTESGLVIMAGRHFVNRINYFVTTTPWQAEDEEYEW